jgi:sRNA-binding carbon storage regulator CsrA
MHVVMRNIGEKIVTSTNIVVTVLAVRDGAVLFGVEPALVIQPREEAAASADEVVAEVLRQADSSPARA